MNPITFGNKKTILQAVVFFIVWLLASVCVVEVLVVSLFYLGFIPSIEVASQLGAKVSMVLSPLLSLFLGTMILRAKGLTKDRTSIMLVILGGLLGLGGSFLAMIVPTYLTTRDR
jgi:hypothetical protein